METVPWLFPSTFKFRISSFRFSQSLNHSIDSSNLVRLNASNRTAAPWHGHPVPESGMATGEPQTGPRPVPQRGIFSLTALDVWW